MIGLDDSFCTGPRFFSSPTPNFSSYPQLLCDAKMKEELINRGLLHPCLVKK